MTTEPNPANPSAIQAESPSALPQAPDSSLPPLPVAPTPAAPAPPPAGPMPIPGWLLKIDLVLLVLLLLLSFLLASFPITNSEFFQHLAIGKRISEGAFQFGVDPLTWTTEATATAPAAYWVHHGWLASWLFYAVYHFLGGPALVVGKAILFTATIALLSRIGWTEANRWFVLICLTLAVLVVSTRLVLQPMVFSYLFVAITLFVLDRVGVFGGGATGDGRSPLVPRLSPLWYLPPLFALWANLDAWFILGPLLVGLAWAGVGLVRRYNRPCPVPGKTLGLVFVVGLAACVINPHHVRVFQLPPELGYVLVSAGDAVGLTLPNALVGGGRTVKILQQADPDFRYTLSPLSQFYWRNAGLGLNVAGVAPAPLALLGLLAFTLVALIKANPAAPTFHFTRALFWVLFLLLALLLYRMLPFFALIAAPLTAMTLGEFLHWQKSQSEQAGKHDRGLHLARFVSVPFMALLVALAWPGWLNGPNDFNSQRRVAWHIRPDESLKRAAEKLNALQADGKCSNVFNIGFEVANYCAWYAPDVKCAVDTRFGLYGDRAADYAKARRALIDPNKPEGDWQTLFEERKVDQVAHTKFIKRDKDRDTLPPIWFDPEHWLLRYVDGSIVVFSWSGARSRWPATALADDWNRRAFGEVPLEQRPPAQGAGYPQPLGTWDLFAFGIGPQPVGAGESQMLQVHYNTQHLLELQRVTKRAALIHMSMLASFSMLPESGITRAPTVVAFAHEMNDATPRDHAPPALPILMVRAARIAVADNPYDVPSYGALAGAYETMHKHQEEYWTRFSRGPFPARVRERLRQLQQISAIQTVAQLQPDNFRLQYKLAEIYKQSSLYDLSLDHLQMTLTIMETRKGIDRNLNDAAVKEFQDMVLAFERKVNQRHTKLKELSAGRTPLETAEIAFRGPFLENVGEQLVNTQLGLGKKALDILVAIPPESIKPEQQSRYLQLQFELLIAMGRMDIVAENLKAPNARRAMGHAHGMYQVLVGGVLGNYDTLDQGLVELEKSYRESVSAHQGLWFATMLAPPGMQSSSRYVASLHAPAMVRLGFLRDQQNDLYNVMTLRGIAALEAGQTKTARDIFRDTLKEAGDDIRFADRPMAKRYLELLDGQHKK